MTKNPTLLKWLEEMKELLTPDQVVWIDGSDEQREELRALAVELGELTKLNQDVLPGWKGASAACRLRQPEWSLPHRRLRAESGKFPHHSFAALLP